jgi:hypothetical protein
MAGDVDQADEAKVLPGVKNAARFSHNIVPITSRHLK